MARHGRAYALDGSFVEDLKKLVRESGGLVNRAALRTRKTYTFAGGGTAGFGYAVVRSVDVDIPWQLQASVATPVDRAAGDWEISNDIVTMFTDNVDSRYYKPHIWNGNPETFHVKHLLKTRIEPSGTVVEQGFRIPYLPNQPANPPTQCQIVTS